MTRPYYAIKDRQTNKLVCPVYYDNKMEAKKERNKLNGPRPDDFVEGTQERFYITKVEK